MLTSIILLSFFLLGYELLEELDGASHSSIKNKKFPCPNCPSAFGQKPSLTRHLRYECGQEPRFQCPYCHHRSKKTSDVYGHVRRKHMNFKVFAIDIHGELAKNSLNVSKTHWL